MRERAWPTIEPSDVKRRFVPEPFDAIDIFGEEEWLIDDVLPTQGLAVIYGDSGCGKSFFACDMGIHIARGLAWGGKPVRPGIVVYVIGESPRRFRKRIVAHRRHHAIDNEQVPFYLIGEAADLGQNPGDATLLIARLREEIEGPISAIFLDTFARMTPGADEGSAQEMSTFIANVDRISAAFECLVATIHHTGKDPTRGARGSSALRAAVDVEIFIEGSQEHRTATITKQRDGEGDLTFAFRLETVEIDIGDKIVTSCVLEPLSNWEGATKPSASRKLTDRQKLAMTVLTDMVVDGKMLPPAWNLPSHLRGVTVSAWRTALLSRGAIDKDGKNPRADFQRLKEQLIVRNLMAERDDYVWKAQ